MLDAINQEQNQMGITISTFLPPNLTIVGIGGCGTALLHKIASHDWFLKHYKETAGHKLRLITIDTATGTEDNVERTRMFSLNQKLQGWKWEDGFQGDVTANHCNLSNFALVSSAAQLVDDDTCEMMKRCTYQERNEDGSASYKPIVWWLDNRLSESDSVLRMENYKKYFDIKNTLKEANFSEGVKRKRAVSKAIFYKAITSNPQKFRSECTGDLGSHYAIIAGLGGGTGSGIFMDYARKIKEISPGSTVRLYLILPATSEGIGGGVQVELANAAIALTELEYLRLRGDESLFDYVILTSLETTEYAGDFGNDALLSLDDFGESYPYLFINSLMYNKDSKNANRNRYGFMYNASSLSIEYPIELHKKTKEEFTNYLMKYKEFTEKKASIVNDVLKILKDLPECAVKEMSQPDDVDTDDVKLYRSFIIELEKLWTNEIVSNLQLDVIEDIKIICEGEPDSNKKTQYNNIDKCIDIHVLTSYVRRLLKGLKSSSNDLNGDLTSIIYDNLSMLNGIGSYLTDTQWKLKHPSVVSVLKELLYCNTVSSLDTLNQKIREIGISSDDEELGEHYCNGRLNSATSTLKELESQKKGLEKEIKAVKREISSVVSSFSEEGLSIVQIKDKLSSLSQMADEYCNHIHDKCRVWKDIVDNMSNNPRAEVEYTGDNRLDGPLSNYSYPTSVPDTPYLSNDLRNALTELEKGYSDYYYYLYRYLYSKRHNGFFARMGRPEELSPDNLEDKVRTALGTIQSGYEKLHLVNPVDMNYSGDFSLSIELNISKDDIVNFEKSNLDKEITKLVEKLSEKIGGTCEWSGEETNAVSFTGTGTFTVEEKKEIEAVLRDIETYDEGMKNLSTTLYTIHNQRKDENSWDTRKSNVENKIKELSDNVAVLKGESDFLVKILKLANNITAELYPAYSTAKTAVPNQLISHRANTPPTTGNYRAISSWSTLALKLASSPDATSLKFFDTGGDIGQKEISHMVAEIKRLYPELAKPAMIGIQNVCYAQDNGDTWKLMDVTLLVSSQSQELSRQFSESVLGAGSLKETIETELKTSFQVDNALVSVHDAAMPWTCGLTLITSGNYLENILGFNSDPNPGAFYTAYQALKDNPLHHVLLLEKGEYVVRDWIPDDSKRREYSKKERRTETAGDTGWEELISHYSQSFDLKERMREEIAKNSRPTNSNPEISEFESSFERNEI